MGLDENVMVSSLVLRAGQSRAIAMGELVSRGA